MTHKLRVQKALHLYQEQEKARPKHHGHTYAMLEKYDGWYGYIDLGCNSRIMSRAGRVIPSLEELSKTICKGSPWTEGIRLIFEIMIPDMGFAELNGVLNRKYSQAEGAYLMVHDFILLGGTSMAFRERYKLAEETVAFIGDTQVRLAPISSCSNKESDWREEVEGIWAKGGEGLILKRWEAPYGKAERNYDLMKIKEELTLDLLVVDTEGGKGKYADTLGALVLRDKAGIHHSVSGMTDNQRALWWEDESLIVGQVVEVKAMKKLPDGQLREPRFKSIRWDKEVTEID
jgi:ATP-dependent DNA ligase